MELPNIISSQYLRHKHGPKLFWGLACLFLLWSIVRMGWITYTQAEIRKDNYKEQNVEPIAPPKKKQFRVNDISNANLFGDPKPKAVAVNTPKTTLNLKLTGILSASNDYNSRAIIVNKKKVKPYSVGQEITGSGASVKEILDKEVLLNRNGATERLPLFKPKAKNKSEIITYLDSSQEKNQSN